MGCDPDFAYAINCKAYKENNDFTRQRAENCPLVEIKHYSQDGDTISRADAKQQISEWATIITKPTLLDKDATMVVLDTLPSAEAEPKMTEEVREALMRLTMCAREECAMCKYKDECGFDFQYKISTENMNTILDAFISAEAVPTHGRLIDADALIDKLPKEYLGSTIHLLINDAPTAQADRPHGEWYQIKDHKIMGEGYLWHCSICDYKVYQDSSKDYPTENFCPNCGAKMKGADDETD
jgi:hypothetical protein